MTEETKSPVPFDLPNLDPQLVEVAEGMAYDVVRSGVTNRHEQAALLVSGSREVHDFLLGMGCDTSEHFAEGRKLVHATVLLLCDLHEQAGLKPMTDYGSPTLAEADATLTKIIRDKAKQLLPHLGNQERIEEEVARMRDMFVTNALAQGLEISVANEYGDEMTELLEQMLEVLKIEIRSHGFGNA